MSNENNDSKKSTKTSLKKPVNTQNQENIYIETEEINYKNINDQNSINTSNSNQIIDESLNNEAFKKVQLDEFNEIKKIKENNSLELLKDIPLKVVVELGKAVLKIGDLMELGVGSIIELNKLYGDPVDIYVNNKLIGRGEVVIIDEDFAVRITEIITNTDVRK